MAHGVKSKPLGLDRPLIVDSDIYVLKTHNNRQCELLRAPSVMTRLTDYENGSQASIKRFLRPGMLVESPSQRCHELYVPQATFRATNICQQLLSAELGWPTPRSFNTWHSVRARRHMARLQLPPVYETFSTRQRHAVSMLELQQTSDSCSGASTLAAVGYGNGTMHIITVADLLNTAQAASRACQSAAVHTDNAMNDTLSAYGPTYPAAAAAVPPRAVMTVDLQDRLFSCCWAPAGGEFNEMVTAGTAGIKVRRFVEARHHEYALKPRAGTQLVKVGPVKYLDRSAAYQLVATKFGGLVLWDCRAGSKAVIELATGSQVQLLQPMPGGTVLLTAAADGQMSLYDVRRVSSNSSSVVNFGSGRTPKQLITSFNVPARAEQAASAAADFASATTDRTASEADSSSSSGMQVYPYFADVQLNPVDCNLVAYVRPDLQVGLLDLYSKKVLQQVCVTQVIGTAAGAAAAQMTCYLPQATACGCWDPQGRVLYTHGLLRQHSSTDAAASGALHLQPTVAAVDLGSWYNGRLRRQSGNWCEFHGAPDNQGAAADDTASAEQQDKSRGANSSRDNSVTASARCQGGQVLHLPLSDQAIPTALAVCKMNGELLTGTLQGDVMCRGLSAMTPVPTRILNSVKCRVPYESLITLLAAIENVGSDPSPVMMASRCHHRRYRR